MTHTPGPWKAVEQYFGRDAGRSFPTTSMRVVSEAVHGPYNVPDFLIDLHFDTQPYYTADGDLMGYEPTETGKANARLIAAAPELLSALKVMVDWTAHAFDADDPDMDLPELEQARAAIQKAEQSGLHAAPDPAQMQNPDN